MPLKLEKCFRAHAQQRGGEKTLRTARSCQQLHVQTEGSTTATATVDHGKFIKGQGTVGPIVIKLTVVTPVKDQQLIFQSGLLQMHQEMQRVTLGPFTKGQKIVRRDAA